MIENRKICRPTALLLALTLIAGCTSQTANIKAAAPQSISEGEAGCLKTHGPLVKADIIDRKTVVFLDLEENIYRVGTRDACLVTTDIRQISFLHVGSGVRTYGVARNDRQICTKKLDRVKVGYFVPQVRPGPMNCLITSVSVISDEEYEALMLAATGKAERPPPILIRQDPLKR